MKSIREDIRLACVSQALSTLGSVSEDKTFTELIEAVTDCCCHTRFTDMREDCLNLNNHYHKD